MTDAARPVKPFARIAGTGRAVPENILTNADFEKIVDTNDEWITTRTGIKERRVIRRGEKNSDYSIKAAKLALEDAGVRPDELDFIILSTISGDMRFPATAIFVQAALQANNATVWDVSATCSGFLFALYQAEALIALKRAKKILVIGTELLTPITDYSDRSTCILFGDGSGAAVVTEATDDTGILSTYIGTNGDHSNLLYSIGHGTAGSVSSGVRVPGEDFLQMNGNEVFKHAVRVMGKSANIALERAGLTAQDIDWMVPHQANLRIIEATASRLKLPMDKVFVTIHKYGNTSSASIPTALDEARKTGAIKNGQTVLCVAFGGGFTWGGAVIRF
jgi:3-oxoacyl-[acyl-carrier-protein] synthase III